MVTFLQWSHNWHPKDHPWKWDIWCLFKFKVLIWPLLMSMWSAQSCFWHHTKLGTLTRYWKLQNFLYLMLGGVFYSRCLKRKKGELRESRSISMYLQYTPYTCSHIKFSNLWLNMNLNKISHPHARYQCRLYSWHTFLFANDGRIIIGLRLEFLTWFSVIKLPSAKSMFFNMVLTGWWLKPCYKMTTQ